MNFKRIIILFLIFSLLLSLSAFASSGEIVDPYTLYSYEQMCSDLSALQSIYPDLISVSSIGKSVEGRDIPVFRLGKGEREILLCASMHAREYIGTNFVMYMAEQYCIGYTANQWYAGLSYRKLLDNVCFVIVPMLNPDGVNLAQNGIENAEAREKLEKMEMVDTWKNGFYAWKANINGVDLNRNWPYFWSEDTEVKGPASANFNGTAPVTEPEVMAMKSLIDSTPFYMFCSFHTSGEVIYWIDTSNSQQMVAEHAPIIARFAGWIGYTMLGYENISSFGGYMVNYARGTYNKPCFTVELCPIQVHYPYTDYAGLRSTVRKVLPLGLLMADEVIKMSDINSEATPPTDEIPEVKPENKPKQVQVHIDGVPLVFEDMAPVIENGRTLVPIRAVCESLGLRVDYKSGEVKVSDESTEVILNIGSNKISVNSEIQVLDTSPKIINRRTLLPIRAVLEAFGHSLDWDGANKIVLVHSKSANNDIVITE